MLGPHNPTSLQQRRILFIGIVGIGMILAAILLAIFGPPRENDTLTAEGLQATAAALDERATEIAFAATRLADAPNPQPRATRPTPSQADVAAVQPTSAPVGAQQQTADGMAVRVLQVNWDAWPLVAAENQFNEPPGDGKRMILIEVEATNVSGDASKPLHANDANFRLVGSRGIVYTPFDADSRCGVIPNELDKQIFPGATTTGNICFQAPIEENDFRLVYLPSGTWDETVVLFALPE